MVAAESVRDHSFVPCRCGKKEGILDRATPAPAIHTGKKILGKMAGHGALLG
jgi:hypothetical protein